VERDWYSAGALCQPLTQGVRFQKGKKPNQGFDSTVKKCYIIAGPNGSGKTTFANEFLPVEAECLNFINADLIALGLSPFQPEKMYKPLADAWIVFDTSGKEPVILDEWEEG
jgi:predicted ABC-type ATPase